MKFAKEEKDPNKAISHYLSAEAIYRGDFLEEELYVEWCAAKRERLREVYISVLTEIMKAYEDNGDIDLSVEYACKILNTDTLRTFTVDSWSIMQFWAKRTGLKKHTEAVRLQ
ncbi:MAG: bacterial transcriptional activator domain-containing protein [Thermodesulfobacteriota bacterium]|nr:bacterial transcriptional activator domain-containing protein [Thermodesulfobacteriota bacterium]